MLASKKDFEVVGHSNQVLLNFKAHQSNTSKHEIPNTFASDPHHSAGLIQYVDKDTEDELYLCTLRRHSALGCWYM